MVSYLRGELSRAQELFIEALATSRAVGYRRSEAYALVNLGDVYRDTGDTTRALEMYDAGLKISCGIHEGFLIIYTLLAMSEAHRLTAHLDQAEELDPEIGKLSCRKALRLWSPTGARWIKSYTSWWAVFGPG